MSVQRDSKRPSISDDVLRENELVAFRMILLMRHYTSTETI
jgi:hypothetical protein